MRESAFMPGTIYAVVTTKQYAVGAYGVLTHPYNRRMENIASRLRALMVGKGLSQYRLWKLSGVSQPTIKRILDGESKEPDKSTVQRLASALGCSYGWLYDGHDADAASRNPAALGLAGVDEPPQQRPGRPPAAEGLRLSRHQSIRPSQPAAPSRFVRPSGTLSSEQADTH